MDEATTVATEALFFKSGIFSPLLNVICSYASCKYSS